MAGRAGRAGQGSVGELREDLVLGQNRNHHKRIIIVLPFQGTQINLVHHYAHRHITNTVGECANGQTPIRNVSKRTNPQKKGKRKIKRKKEWKKERAEERESKKKKGGKKTTTNTEGKSGGKRVGKKKNFLLEFWFPPSNQKLTMYFWWDYFEIKLKRIISDCRKVCFKLYIYSMRCEWIKVSGQS